MSVSYDVHQLNSSIQNQNLKMIQSIKFQEGIGGKVFLCMEVFIKGDGLNETYVNASNFETHYFSEAIGTLFDSILHRKHRLFSYYIWCMPSAVKRHV